MIVAALVAVGQHGEIGRAGALPWPPLRADRRWFRARTLGKAVVMGRATFAALGDRPLAGRHNIVLTHDPEALARACGRPERVDPADGGWGWACVGEPAGALARAAGAWRVAELVVIGGAATYDAFADTIGRWDVTRVGGTFPDADVHYARALAFAAPWVEVVRQTLDAKPYPAEVVTYMRETL